MAAKVLRCLVFTYIMIAVCDSNAKVGDAFKALPGLAPGSRRCRRRIAFRATPALERLIEAGKDLAHAAGAERAEDSDVPQRSGRERHWAHRLLSPARRRASTAPGMTTTQRCGALVLRLKSEVRARNGITDLRRTCEAPGTHLETAPCVLPSQDSGYARRRTTKGRISAIRSKSRSTCTIPSP